MCYLEFLVTQDLFYEIFICHLTDKIFAWVLTRPSLFTDVIIQIRLYKSWYISKQYSKIE